MDQQQDSGPPVMWPTTETFSEMEMLAPLHRKCMPMPVTQSPIIQHTPNVSFTHAAYATPLGRSDLWKKTSDHLEKKISPMYNKHLARNQQFVSKGNENIMTPRVQKVPIIMKRTTVLLIQNYYCHLPKSHVPRNQPEILTNVHVHDTLWDILAHFQEGPMYSTLK